MTTTGKTWRAAETKRSKVVRFVGSLSPGDGPFGASDVSRWLNLPRHVASHALSELATDGVLVFDRKPQGARPWLYRKRNSND